MGELRELRELRWWMWLGVCFFVLAGSVTGLVASPIIGGFVAGAAFGCGVSWTMADRGKDE